MCEPISISAGLAALGAAGAGLSTAGIVASAAIAGASTAYSVRQAKKAAQATADLFKGANNKETTPPPPTPVAPPPVAVEKQTPTQASQAPDVAAIRKQNAGTPTGYNASSASTLLTGPSGIDTSQLSLGRNTLLGS